MWQKLKNWLHDNKANLLSPVCASLVVGVFMAAICIHPPILLAISSLSIFGITPLAFLTGLKLPLALLALGAVVSGVTLSLISIVIAIDHELMNVFKHSSDLLKNDGPQPETAIENPLYKEWLPKPIFFYEYRLDDMSDDDGVLSSSDWEFQAEGTLDELEEVHCDQSGSHLQTGYGLMALP